MSGSETSPIVPPPFCAWGLFTTTTGEYEKAVTYLRQAAELTADDRQRERFGMAGIASVLARHWLARTRAQLGDFSEAFAVAREGLDIHLSMDSLTSVPSAHLAVGYVHLHRGERMTGFAAVDRRTGYKLASERVTYVARRAVGEA